MAQALPGPGAACTRAGDVLPCGDDDPRRYMMQRTCVRVMGASECDAALVSMTDRESSTSTSPMRIICLTNEIATTVEY